MSNSLMAGLLALAANMCFGGASVYFALFGQKISPTWMNAIKAIVATFAFAIAIVLLNQSWIPNTEAIQGLLISGTVGLLIGDWLLFKAFSELGTPRVLLLYSCQPILFLAVEVLWQGRGFSYAQIASILLFVACIVLFSWEKYQTSKTWEWRGIALALSGVLLDGIGVFFTKQAFEADPTLGSMTANFYRAAIAGLVFMIAFRIGSKPLFNEFRRLSRKESGLAIFASLLGTFLALGFYLKAIQIGRLSLVTGVGVTLPVWASLFEIIIAKKKPTRSLYLAMGLFAAAFYLNSIA